METAEALEYIRANHRGVLITFRSDGGLQSSPVTASTDDEGRVIVSSRETAIKVKNLRRDPRATYCGFADGFYGPWVQVEGPAEIVSLPEALELLVDYYRDRGRRAPGLGRLPGGDGPRAAGHDPHHRRAGWALAVRLIGLGYGPFSWTSGDTTPFCMRIRTLVRPAAPSKRTSTSSGSAFCSATA